MHFLEEAVALIRPPRIDYHLVDTLYTISEKGLLLIAIVSLIMSYVMFPVFGIWILLWSALLLLLLSYRLYNILLFRKETERYSIATWYHRFVYSTLLTAVLISMIGVVTIFMDKSVEHHLFIMILLLGFSNGASSSFSIDHRLSTLYSFIITVPLIISTALYGTQLYLLISLTLIIYLMSKVYITVQKLRQEEKILQQDIRINKVKNALKARENLIYNFFQTAPMAILSYDKNLIITDANHVLLDLFHSKREEIVGMDITSLPDKRALPVLKKALQFGAQVYQGPYTSRKGKELWIELICFPFNNISGETTGAIGMIHDKTNEHTALTKLTFNAKHDHLTSLLNRRGLKAYMKSFIKQKEHETFYSILFYLDLNKFKYINDSLGHKTGDELLIAIANRLQDLSEEQCIISRFGGDEFIILYPFATDTLSELDGKAQECMARIKTIFAKPFMLDGMNLSMQTSIGIVIIDPGEQDMEEIIRHADIAMYQAKKSHHSHISYYDTKLDQERKELFLLQHDLAFAIQHEQLKLHLQPLVSIMDDRLIAAECLIRWEHPKFGLLFPDRFIPAAIETGTISTITWWIIEEICKNILILKRNGMWHLKYISVNVDAKQLLINHFVEELLSILKRYRMENSELVIEITEQSLIDNFEGTQEIITSLKQEGINCAIDDFGTGYSSLSYLKKLSFDTLKIDRAFIKDIQERPDDIILINTILDIGRKFDYTIVVEGIETLEQKQVLQNIDADLIYQGYLFEKPMGFEPFVQKYLSNR